MAFFRDGLPNMSNLIATLVVVKLLLHLPDLLLEAFDLAVELVPGHILLMKLLLSFPDPARDLFVLTLAKLQFVLARAQHLLVPHLERQMLGDLWIVL